MEQVKFFNERLDRAIAFATYAHRKQVRKTEGEMPYICHPMSVAFTLYAAGLDENTVIAGMFHDLLEDTGTTAKDIETGFGEDVRKLVELVSEDKSLPWEDRKHLNFKNILESKDERVKAIFAVDKTQNVHSISGYLKEGRPDFWSFFKKGKEATVLHYLELAEKLSKNWEHPLSRQFLELAKELKALSEK
jgi:(p)ppGpp synthase/HD superfamily hydrolase